MASTIEALETLRPTNISNRHLTTKKIEPSKNELVSTNKTEDTSKMKCTICKQKGHNKRSCKKMTTPVSAQKIETETDVKVILPVKVEMNWNQWTDKSKNIPFKSTTAGIGCGEEKVARELETNVLGQNSPYDMKPTINGIPIECDVKKLDTQNDFNTGVKGRDALRPIKTKILLLLESICLLSESTICISKEKETLKSFTTVSPDELAVGTIKKLKSVCEMLNMKRKNILESIPIVQPFTDTTGPVSMTLYSYYTVCEKMGRSFPEKYSLYKPTLEILNHLENIYIQRPNLLTDDLNNLVNFLKETTLIVVDEKKGYIVMSDVSRIKFLRITRGHPRFQILF